MNYTVVTEGISDVLLLRAILGVEPDDANITFVAAGGWSAADSMARSLLVRGDSHIALVVDADATDAHLAEERKRFLESSLNQISDRNRWHVAVFTPEIESLLFQDRSILEALLGDKVHDRDILRAEYEPRNVFRELLHGRPLISFLDEKLKIVDLAPLKQAPSVAALAKFLRLRPTMTAASERQRVAAHVSL